MFCKTSLRYRLETSRTAVSKSRQRDQTHFEQTIARQACITESNITQREQTPLYNKPKGTDSLENRKIYMNMDSPHIGKVKISKLHRHLHKRFCSIPDSLYRAETPAGASS